MRKKAISKLKTEVLKRQKTLAGIYQKHSRLKLADYAKIWQVKKSGLNSDLAKIISHQMGAIYGKPEATEIFRQLLAFPLVSTIDHHGILSHPFFINSNLIYSLRGDLKYLIVLSTEGVSLNNSSWPGCLLYHQAGDLKRLSVFPDKEKNKAVLGKKAFLKKDMQALLEKIKHQRIKSLVKRIFLNPKVLKQPRFSKQVSLINFQLWQKIFPGAPKVVYLPLESLVSEVIRKIICADKNHILHRLIFTKRGWSLAEKYFSGLKGAFSKDGKGSFLFWAIDAKGHRVGLHRKGSRIKDQGLVTFELTPKIIAKALQKDQLYPTSLVCFLTLLYYQITCLGGFNQVNWLTDIKKRFVSLLANSGESGLAKEIKAVLTQNFAEGNLAFMVKGKRLIKATGMDLFAAGQDFYPKYLKLAKKLTLGESIESLLPEIYRIITPAGEREAELLQITDEDIAKENGVEEKVRRVLR